MPDQRIPLQRKDGSISAYAIIDAADLEWLSQWTWSQHKGYAKRNQSRDGISCVIYMHREILGLKYGDPRHGEHKNRIPLDCRRENLRIAERGQRDNQQNRASLRGSSSQYRGVWWDAERCKWHAQVKLDGKRHDLGRFDSEADAGAAASAFRRQHMPFSEDAALSRHQVA